MEEQEQFYMLVSKGIVQRLEIEFDGKPRLAWPIAVTADDANRLAKWLDVWDKGVRGSLIGSVQGETFEGHVELAMREGVVIVCCVRGWNQDGSPVWGYFELEDK